MTSLSPGFIPETGTGLIVPAAYIKKRGDDFLPEAIDIANMAVKESGILTDGLNWSWLNHVSNQNSRIFHAYLHGREKRRNGNHSVLTHTLRVGHAQANEPALLAKGHNPNFLGFKYSNHDVREEAPEHGFDAEEATNYVVNLWPDSQTQRDNVRETIINMTDPPGFEGCLRIQVQAFGIGGVKKGMAELPGDDQYGKVYDKIDHPETDILEIRSGNMLPKEFARRILQAYAKAVMKGVVVREATLVRLPLIARYENAVAALKDIVKLHHSTRAIDEAVNSQLSRGMPGREERQLWGDTAKTAALHITAS